MRHFVRWVFSAAVLLVMDGMRVSLHAQDNKWQLREEYCAFRTTPTERVICMDRTLTRWDGELNDHYTELRRKMTPSQFTPVLQKQRSWLLERDQCGADVACLTTKYKDRTAQLERYLENISFSKGVSAGRDVALTDSMVWKFQETGRAAARGARLDFSVPGTDAAAFSALCSPGSGTATLEFGYRTPGLSEGDKVALNIDTGTYQASEPGFVVGTRRQEGVSGIQVVVALDDPLWAAMMSGQALSYRRRTDAPVRLDLKGSAFEVKQFVAACQSLASARPAAALVTGNQPSCKATSRLRSERRREKATLTFLNRTKTLRRVLWLSYDGIPEIYANLAPGQGYTANTFRNHIWMFTDGPGNCIETYLVRSGATRFDIKAPSPFSGPDND